LSYRPEICYKYLEIIFSSTINLRCFRSINLK